MSDGGTVKVSTLVFGAATVFTTSVGTGTSLALNMPRDDYTVQFSVTTTGTSIGGGNCIFQASNDNAGWLPVGTAAVLSTNASTASTVATAGFAVTSKYAFGRGVVITTGTAISSAYVGL